MWSTAGVLGPLPAAAWAVPQLVEHLGVERFGQLALVWTAIGYFSLFDLGLGRALTRAVASRLAHGRAAEIPHLTSTATRLVWRCGIAGGVAIAVVVPWVWRQFSGAPEELSRELWLSFVFAGLALPFVLSTSALIGVLQAHHRFKETGIIQGSLGVVTFAGSGIAAREAPSLAVVTFVLLAARVGGWAISRRVCARAAIRDSPRDGPSEFARELLWFGGWVTITNVIGPLMVYLDRFLIAALAPADSLAYYTVPFEAVTKIWVLVDALLAVAFPALAGVMAADPQRARELLSGVARVVLFLVALPTGLAVLAAPQILAAWLGDGFARESAPILRWLGFGVFVNSMARVPFMALQVKGRPDAIAKLHVAELVPYMLGLWLLVGRLGAAGAAIAWTLRTIADAIVIFLLAIQLNPELAREHRRCWGYLSVGAGSFVLLLALEGSAVKIASAIGIACVSLYIIWPDLGSLRRQLMASRR